MDILRQLKDRRLKTVDLVLSQMPVDLHTMYERILFQLCWFDPGTAVSNQKLVYSILLFVAFSQRSVTVAEAAEFAISEDASGEIELDDRFEDPMSILPLLGTLVNVQDSILSLSHRSVKDFLESSRALWGSLQIGLLLGISRDTGVIATSMDTFIARRCLGYLALSHTPPRQVAIPKDVKDPNTTYLLKLQRDYPLLDYSARMWSFHLQDPTSQRNSVTEMSSISQYQDLKDRQCLWQGWLFLQRADIWDRQSFFAEFLCQCFLRSLLMTTWAQNFWQRRQKYRISNSELDAEAEQTGMIVSSAELASATRLNLRSVQFFDLAMLLLEVASQKAQYTQWRRQLFESGKKEAMLNFFHTFRLFSRDMIPRMGEKYHDSISGCLEMVTELAASKGLSDFHTQNRAEALILEPLQSSASSGFRRSRGIHAYKSADLKNLQARVALQEKVSRASVPVEPYSIREPPVDSYSQLTARERGNMKTIDAGRDRQGFIACRRCRNRFASQDELDQHTRSSDHCSVCRTCIQFGSLPAHNREYHRIVDPRWSVT